MARRGDLFTMHVEPMDCPTARELISAAIDDEIDAATLGHLDGHLELCPTCRNWQDQAHALRRSVAMTPARSEADLTSTILARAGVPDVGRGEWVRALLGAISLTLLLVNVPMLITGIAAGADAHVGRHLGRVRGGPRHRPRVRRAAARAGPGHAAPRRCARRDAAGHCDHRHRDGYLDRRQRGPPPRRTRRASPPSGSSPAGGTAWPTALATMRRPAPASGLRAVE